MTTLTGNTIWGPGSAEINVSAGSSFNLNDSDNKVRTRFIVPKSGTLDRIGISVTGVTGNPPAYSVGLYDMAGNLYGSSAAQDYDFTTTGFVWVTLSTPATAVLGDLVDAILQPSGTPPDGSNFIQVTVGYGPLGTTLPKGHYFTTGWLATSSPPLGVLYDDDSVAVPGMLGSRQTVSTATTPDEVGALLQVPFACSCCGALVHMSSGTVSADLTVKLLAADNTQLASFTHDASYIVTSSTGAFMYYWTPVNLAASTNYRLVVTPTTTNQINPGVAYMADAGSRQWLPEGTRWQLTTRTDGGSWTEDTTAVLSAALLLDEITLPDAGGSPWAGGIIAG